MSNQKAKTKEEALKEFSAGQPIDLLNYDFSENEAAADAKSAPAEAQAKVQSAALEEVPELLEFVKAYPDVFDIPKEVEEKVKGGAGLLSAYREYENAQLKEQLRALQQNEKNTKATPGSVGGDATGDEELDELLRVFKSVFKQ